MNFDLDWRIAGTRHIDQELAWIDVRLFFDFGPGTFRRSCFDAGDDLVCHRRGQVVPVYLEERVEMETEVHFAIAARQDAGLHFNSQFGVERFRARFGLHFDGLQTARQLDPLDDAFGRCAWRRLFFQIQIRDLGRIGNPAD